MLFKGYLPSGGADGKQPMEKYKDRTDFYEIEDVENLNSYCGILGDDFIQIDLDDGNQAEILLQIVEDLNVNCHVLQTTRGLHFYFRNYKIERRSQGNTLVIGLTADIGLGIQNSPIPLKINGVERKWLRQSEEIEFLPAWLTPIGKKGIDFSKMGDGDGRNSTLFSYILSLQGQGLTKEEIRESIRIINKYIMSDELDSQEVEVILRDESFLKETFYLKGKLQYQPLAEYLRDNNKIIKINDELHIYKDGFYSPSSADIERCMLKYMVNSTNGQRVEILNYLDLLCREEELCSPKYVCVGNGILDLETLELYYHSDKYIITNKIKWNYNPNAYDKTLDRTLNKLVCKDKKMRKLLEEMIGYCLLRRNEMGASFILTGGGSNGKSTLFKVMHDFIGEDNISNVGLQELGQRFKTFQLAGKLANIGDDISNEYMSDNSTFKNLCTGDKINVERKGKDAYDMESYAKLIFSANELPRINDLTDGLKRRVIFIPFNAKFSKTDKDFDPFILDKLLNEDSMEYLMVLAVQGLKRLLNNRAFTECEACNRVWDEYESINNPVIAFLEEHDIHREIVSDVYTRYTLFCAESGLKPLSKPIFGREVCKRGYVSDKRIRIKGAQKRVYWKISEEC